MAQTQAFRGVARATLRTPEGVQQFVYHSTAVVAVHPDGAIVLDSGGWKTTTTKTAMNQASSQAGLGFKVYARDFEWFVSWRGTELEFTDGMRLTAHAEIAELQSLAQHIDPGDVELLEAAGVPEQA